MSSNLKKFNGVIQDSQTQAYLNKVLGEKRSAFVANLTALVSSNTSLQECEPVTLLYAGIKATALDLPLDSNLGFAYVVPFKNAKKQVTEATFQIGAKGFKQLAIRTGQFRYLNNGDVREGEISQYDYLTGSVAFAFEQDRAKREKLPIIGYFSYFELVNGFKSTLYMTIDEIKKHGKRYSQSFKKDYGLWADDFDAMAKKTVTKLNLSKNAPLSTEMKDAIVSDQAVIREDTVEHIDNDDINIVATVIEEKKEKMENNEATQMP